MKRLLVLFACCFFSSSFLFAQNSSYTKQKIDSIIDVTDALYTNQHKSFSLKKSIRANKMITEKWDYLKTPKGLLYFKISYTLDSIDFTEEYYLDQGNLIFGSESEIYHFPSSNPPDSIGWGWSYYFSRNKMIDQISFGHGKSEIDGWDIEKEVLLRYAKRRYRRPELSR